MRILVSSLGLSVRQRPLVYVDACGGRHSNSHSAQPPDLAQAGLPVFASWCGWRGGLRPCDG
jgi:hypothetical protein